MPTMKSSHRGKTIAHARKPKRVKAGHPTKPTAHRHRPDTDNKALAALLRKENILKEFEQALRGAGWIGDARVPLILFLCFTSRLLKNPVSVVVKGPSGGGKSKPLEIVLQFLPDGSYHVATALSPKVLTRMGMDLTHKTLVVYEATGLDNEEARGFVRTLLTEHKISYPTLGADRKPQTYVAEGPTNLITTTTREVLHEETETRVLSIFVEESKEHTRDILMQQSLDASGSKPLPMIDFSVWHALQEYIKRRSAEVVIPYLPNVAALMGDVPTRIHRDFPRMASLISAHALLHRCTRARRGKAVVANLHDYAAVRALIKTALEEGLESSVRPAIKAIVGAAEALLVGKPTVTVQDLAQTQGLHRSTASRHVGAAIKLGFLRNIETNPAKQARIVVGDPLPSKRDILPTAKAVSKHWKASRSAPKKVVKAAKVKTKK